MGKISASGVDVVEGTATAPITITLHDHSISVSQSSNVQIGDSNTQGMKVRIDKLIAAVDHSQASATEKAEAKSLLEKLASNPLVKAVLGAVLGGHSN
jgi:geranylgeranyl pyrophosphate synthase